MGLLALGAVDHAPLLPPAASDVAGFLCIALSLIVSAGGGIGGGGVLLPVYILVLSFSPRQAVPLASATMLGAALANTLCNARKRHPVADRPAIDWGIVVVLLPTTLAGALLGSTLSVVVPEIVTIILVVLVLMVASYVSLKQVMRLRQKETEEIARTKSVSEAATDAAMTPSAGPKIDPTGVATPLTDPESSLSESLLSDQDSVDLMKAVDAAIGPLPHSDLDSNGLTERLLADQESSDADGRQSCTLTCGGGGDESPKHVPPDKQASIDKILQEERHPKLSYVLPVVLLFSVILLLNLLKGGGHWTSPLGIECGSTWFWVAQGALLVWILCMSGLGQTLVLRDAARKEAADYAHPDGDVRWSRASALAYSLLFALSGLLLGLCGTGGGTVRGPLLLRMGLHPAVVSATSACMSLFVNATAVSTFAVYGLLVPDYAVAGGALGFCATLVGQAAMNRLLARTRRNSYIALSIAIILLVSTVLVLFTSVLSLLSGEEILGLGKICTT